MTGPVGLAATRSALVRPLIAGLESGPFQDRFTLSVGSESECVDWLAREDVGLALLSPAGFLAAARRTGWDLRIVPGVAASVRSARGEIPNLLPADVLSWQRRVGLPYPAAFWVGRQDAVNAEVARLLTELPGEATSGVDCTLGARELSGLAAYLHFLAGNDKNVLTPRIRFFDFAYVPESPAPVAWPLPPPSNPARIHRLSLDTMLAAAGDGERLPPEQAIRLYEEASLLDLGQAADQRRRALHPDNLVTYIIDRNVNYTNLCVTACRFCNFYRPPKSSEGYTLSREMLAAKFAETVAMGGVQILLQGGTNPLLPLAYYEDLFRWTKANFPLALHALSPEEISFIARMENLTIRQVLERLVAAGLDSVPGGGAEILDDEIRRRISPLKCSTATWLEVMREAHAIGLRTTATMVFGFGENPGHLIAHLERLRALQDQTCGFTAFICWPFQAEGTRMRLEADTTAHRYLRMFSLARLYLDNIPNLQVSWPTMGPSIGQIALRFGGNDFGSAMIEENVVSQAGAVYKLSAAGIEGYVRAAGFIPRRRNMRYELLPEAASLASERVVPSSSFDPGTDRLGWPGAA